MPLQGEKRGYLFHISKVRTANYIVTPDGEKHRMLSEAVDYLYQAPDPVFLSIMRAIEHQPHRDEAKKDEGRREVQTSICDALGIG